MAINNLFSFLLDVNPKYEADYMSTEFQGPLHLRERHNLRQPSHILLNTTGDGVAHSQMASWMMTQAHRHHLVDTVCENEAVSEDARIEKLMSELSHLQSDTLYVDQQHKVLYCSVPKVACSSWKGVLASLTGAPEVNGSTPSQILEVHNKDFMTKIGLRQLRDYSFAEAIDIVKHYKKFLMVRHPMERLISAYRDKFIKDNKWTQGFHKRYGRRIIRIYRAEPSSQSLQRGHDVTFPEFLSFVTDTRVPEKYRWNPHWAPYQDLCLPCHINYDYILKYDSFDTDADMLLRRLYHVNNSAELFPTRNAQKVNSKHKINELSDGLPKDMIRKFMKLFRRDFRMFGYTLTEDDYVA